MSSATKRVLAAINKFKIVIIAVAIVLVIIASLMVYSGSWPPLVVVESSSMQHSDTTSYIGVIDTGDLVIQKKISSMSEVMPYLDAYATAYAKDFAAGSEYMSYSEYGDVVIYRPLGSTSRTPIIHRALCLVYYNETPDSFDCPVLKELPASMWMSSGAKTWYDLKSSVTLADIGYNHVSVNINLAAILSSYHSYKAQHPGFTLTSGLITLGDNNNGLIDQGSSINTWSPVEFEWIDGVARGEIPWFGLLKLWISGPAPTSVPENSKTDLFIAIGLIIGIPLLIDVVGYVLERKGIDFWRGVRKRMHLGGKEEGDQETDGPGSAEPEETPPPSPKRADATKRGRTQEKQEPKSTAQQGKRKGKSERKSKR